MVTRQVEAAQKALSALKALRRSPVRVTPKHRVVRTTRYVKRHNEWLTSLSPTASKLLDEDIQRGAEAGLRFWDDPIVGVTRVSECSLTDDESDAGSVVSDACSDWSSAASELLSDDDDDDRDLVAFDVRDESDDEEFFETDGEFGARLSEFCEHSVSDEEEEDPYAETLDVKDAPTELLSMYNDNVEEPDALPLLPAPAGYYAELVEDTDLDADPYAQDLDEVDAPAELEQLYNETQDDLDCPTLLPCSLPSPSVSVDFEDFEDSCDDDLYAEELSFKDYGAFLVAPPCAKAAYVPSVYDYDAFSAEGADQPGHLQPGLLGVACF